MAVFVKYFYAQCIALGAFQKPTQGSQPLLQKEEGENVVPEYVRVITNELASTFHFILPLAPHNP